MASNQQLQILPEELPETLKQSKIVIVKTAWNKHIVDELEKGVTEVCKANHIGIVKTVTVPGAVEIPFAVNTIYKSYSYSTVPDAFIALGCVIKGDTPHFEYVCQSVTHGITMLNVTLDRPVIFGVLTVNTEQQAFDRLGGSHGHKGKEAAETAIRMINIMQNLKGDPDKISF